MAARFVGNTRTRPKIRGQMTRTSTLTTYGLLASGMALFGSATPISKIVGEAFPAMLASGLRMATAAAVLLPVVAIGRTAHDRTPPRELSRGTWLTILGIAGIGTVGFTLALYYGLRIVPGAVGAIVMATTPAVTAVGAVLFFRDRLTRWKGLGLALAVAGVMAVNLGGVPGGQGGNVWLGSLLVFAAVCCEAAYTLLGKRLGDDLSPVRIAMLAAVIAGLVLAPVATAQASGFDWGGPGWASAPS
jgi:drug/metabolite transporter (DMT)-like permease